ncbi:MAG: hypothetical protein PHU71_00040 [Candidatus Gracilibacteria bacterium]|nr:hypothetical protein [Candidatus Gracilibacteria bacterium]
METKTFYSIAILFLLLLNLGLYLPGSSAVNASIPVPGLDAAKEIFPELLTTIADPTKLVTSFASGVKSGGGFESGLEQVNVPMMETVDTVMARCVAWLETQPLPGEELQEGYEEPEFDAEAEVPEYDACNQDSGYGDILAEGSTDLTSLYAKKEELATRKQINVTRCYNMIGNISTAHNRLYGLLAEGERMKEQLQETYKTLKEEMKTLKEYMQLLAETPRVYTDSSCT